MTSHEDGFAVSTAGKSGQAQVEPAVEGNPVSTGGYEAPQGETEMKLAAIWCEVLRIDRVGRDDDFFALGGNSLAGTQLVSRIRTALGVEIPLRLMFEGPTVAGFAEYIGTIQWMASDSSSSGEGVDGDRTEMEI